MWDICLSQSEKEAGKNQRMAAASSVCCCSYQFAVAAGEDATDGCATMAGLEGTSISLTFKIGSGKKAKNQHVTLVRSNAFLGCHFIVASLQSCALRTLCICLTQGYCPCVRWLAGEDGNNKERQWKATRTDWIDPNLEGVEM